MTPNPRMPLDKRRITAVFAGLAIALPNVAWPVSLDELLVLPIEKLLTLHIVPGKLAPTKLSLQHRASHAG